MALHHMHRKAILQKKKKMEKGGKINVGHFGYLDQHAASLSIHHDLPILSIAVRSALYHTGFHVDISLRLLSGNP